VQATTSFEAAFGSITADFRAASGPKERAGLLLKYADRLPHLPAGQRTDANRVMGCIAQVRLGLGALLPALLEGGLRKDIEIAAVLM
jgi:sulfur transfer protein SufE